MNHVHINDAVDAMTDVDAARFAVLCASQVYSEPTWVEWATSWRAQIQCDVPIRQIVRCADRRTHASDASMFAYLAAGNAGVSPCDLTLAFAKRASMHAAKAVTKEILMLDPTITATQAVNGALIVQLHVLACVTKL